MANELQAQPQNRDIAAYMADAATKNYIAKAVGETNAQTFVSSIISAVQATPALKQCTNSSIVSAALLGNSLNLSPSPQMGFYYMVPYDNKNLGVKEAQFQMGYKGYIQLANRSGQYRRLNVVEVKEGELISYNPFDEEIKLKLIEDYETRKNAKTIGYYAMMELVNGFKKSIYWSRDEMEDHARTYSAGYRSDLKYGKKNTFWSKNFRDMAYKTMLRQLISKWGPMSTDMQMATVNDMAVIRDSGEPDYVDNQEDIIDTPNPLFQEVPVEADKSEVKGANKQ